MGRPAVEATDEIERELLIAIRGRGSAGRLEAAALLDQPPYVIDRMWASSKGRARREMRLSEATKIAAWLGYDLELNPIRARESPDDAGETAPAWRDHPLPDTVVELIDGPTGRRTIVALRRRKRGW